MDNIATLNYKHQYRDSGDYLKKPLFSKNDVNKYGIKSVFQSNRNKVKPIVARFNLLIGRGKRAKIKMGKELHETRTNKIQSIPGTLAIIKKRLANQTPHSPQDAQEMLRFDHNKTRENLLRHADNCRSPYTQALNTYYSSKATAKLEKSDYYVTLYNAMENILEGNELKFFNEMLELAMKGKKNKKLTDNKYRKLRDKLDSVAIEYTQKLFDNSKTMENIQNCDSAVKDLIGVKQYIDSIDSIDSIESNSTSVGLFKSFLQHRESSDIKDELLEYINEVLNTAIKFMTQNIDNVNNNTDTNIDKEKLFSDIYYSLTFILSVISNDELKLSSEERFKIIYAVLCDQLCEFMENDKDFFDNDDKLNNLSNLCERLSIHFNKNKTYYYKGGDCIKHILEAKAKIIESEENPYPDSKHKSVTVNTDPSNSLYYKDMAIGKNNPHNPHNPQTASRRNIGLEAFQHPTYIPPFIIDTKAEMHSHSDSQQVSSPKQPQLQNFSDIDSFSFNPTDDSIRFKTGHRYQTQSFNEEMRRSSSSPRLTALSNPSSPNSTQCGYDPSITKDNNGSLCIPTMSAIKTKMISSNKPHDSDISALSRSNSSNKSATTRQQEKIAIARGIEGDNIY